MFYEGDLQSGISKAVQESKLVACFVTDEGEESQLWETEFLQDSNIKSLLAEQAVLLRLIAGSEAAGHLAALFPLPKTPTLVVIRNGELKEYLVSGSTKEDFTRRLLFALGGTPTQLSSSQPSTSTSSTLPTTPGGTPQTQAVQDLLAERRARLEVHKREQDAKDKAKRAAEAKARQDALDSAAVPGSQASADKKYALMQKKRQQDARDERARILKRVEDDKAERREREATRKAQAAATKQESESQAPPAMSSSSKRSSTECALQVRLFDGSTIRSRFPAQGSLRADVRPWIDEKQEGDTPYTFKQILTPLPNKNIETSEEEKSLQSLGLTPNATLILLPVSDFTSAYESKSVLGRGVSTGYGLVSSGFGAVTGLLGSVLGGGGSAPAAAQDGSSSSAGSSGTANTAKVRTLRDQEDKKDDREFYNGNALNFEPRKDDDNQKKED